MKIIVFDGDDNTNYYLADTKEQERKAKLKEMHNYFDYGMYYEPEPPNCDREKKALQELGVDELVALPEPLRSKILDDVSKATILDAKSLARYHSEMRLWDALVEVMGLPVDDAINYEYEREWNGKTIYTNFVDLWMDLRSDYEYEDWDIINVKEA